MLVQSTPRPLTHMGYLNSVSFKICRFTSTRIGPASMNRLHDASTAVACELNVNCILSPIRTCARGSGGAAKTARRSRSPALCIICSSVNTALSIVQRSPTAQLAKASAARPLARGHRYDVVCGSQSRWISAAFVCSQQRQRAHLLKLNLRAATFLTSGCLATTVHCNSGNAKQHLTRRKRGAGPPAAA